MMTMLRRRFRSWLGLLLSASPLLVLLLVLAPATPAQATTHVVVGDGVHPSSCNMNSLAAPMNVYADALITFNCGGPATIAITQSGGLNVLGGQRLTISGGDAVTITGMDSYRLFYVDLGAVLTLTHIVLTQGSDTVGGAIWNNGGYLGLDHVTLSHNHSGSSGGAIQAESGSITQLTNSLVVTNTSGQLGGAIVNHGALTVTHSSLLTNTAGAAGYGGAILNYGPFYAANDTLNGNSAQYGGAVDNSGGALQMYASLLTHNTADYGGAVDMNGAGTAFLHNTTLLQNTGNVLGGGLYVELGGLAATYDGTHLTGNTAQAGGGAYDKTGSNLSLFDSFVEDNQATNENGGGLYVEKGALGGGSNVVFSGNHAEGSGGAIDSEGDNLSLIGASLIGNSARYGAGLYSAGSQASLLNSLVQGNQGLFGAGVFNIGPNMEVGRSTLQGNSGNLGPGLENDPGGSVFLYQSTVAGNTGQNGAGLYNDATATMTVQNSTVSGNLAAGAGGGLENGGAVTLFNATFSNNGAPTGGAVNTELGATLLITNTILAYSTDGGNCVGPITAAHRNVSDDNTCGFAGTINGHNPNHLNPLLSGLGHYGGPTPVHMVEHNSPILNALDGSIALGTDQRGLPRPKGGGYEPGAVERQTSDTDVTQWLWLAMIQR
jgi:predicted outer membrane repeat protein